MEEDSMYTPPYKGYGTRKCASKKQVCHRLGKSKGQVKDKKRTVWSSMTSKSFVRVFWWGPSLTISSAPSGNEAESYQRACILAKNMSKKTKRSTIWVSVQGYDDDNSLWVGRTRDFKLKKSYKKYCFNYRITKALNRFNIYIGVYDGGPVLIDKIVLFQGGSKPSVIDEIAEHPFDTGTKGT